MTECPECDESVPEADLCCGKCVAKAMAPYERDATKLGDKVLSLIEERDALRRDLAQETSAHRQTIAERDQARADAATLTKWDERKTADLIQRDRRIAELEAALLHHGGPCPNDCRLCAAALSATARTAAKKRKGGHWGGHPSHCIDHWHEGDAETATRPGYDCEECRE